MDDNKGHLTEEQLNELQGQLTQHWGHLDEQALLATQGDIGILVALIAQQTGQSRQQIESTVRQLIDREPESEGSTGSKGFAQ